jgi:hypothetical protein
MQNWLLLLPPNLLLLLLRLLPGLRPVRTCRVSHQGAGRNPHVGHIRRNDQRLGDKVLTTLKVHCTSHCIAGAKGEVTVDTGPAGVEAHLERRKHGVSRVKPTRGVAPVLYGRDTQRTLRLAEAGGAPGATHATGSGAGCRARADLDGMCEAAAQSVRDVVTKACVGSRLVDRAARSTVLKARRPKIQWHLWGT